MTKEFISAWAEIVKRHGVQVDASDELFEIVGELVSTLNMVIDEKMFQIDVKDTAIKNLKKEITEREQSANCTNCEFCNKLGLGDFACVKDESYFCADYVTENNTCEYFERLENE